MSLLLDTLTNTQTHLEIHAVVECGFLENTCTHAVSGVRMGDYGIMVADQLPSYGTSIEVKAIIQETEHLTSPFGQNSFVLPICPAAMKSRVNEAFAKVESLEREKRNIKNRERWARSTV